MIGKGDAQQSTTSIPLGIPETGSDFPIHMLALPSARAYQYDRDRCIPNETITYALADRIHLSGVVYVTISDGTVYYIAVHHRCEN